MGFQPEIRDIIQSKCKYILYCHDYKFIPHTNPAVYPNFVAPSNELINVAFHKDAHKIICQTQFQKDIYDRNLNCGEQTINFSGNLWSEEHLELFRQLLETKKNSKYAIVDSKYPQKGVQEAKDFCEKNNLDYDIIGDPDYLTFLKKLSLYSHLVFFPSTPETCCRIIVEAKMIGLEVTTNELIGASYEEWYKLNGKELIDCMKNKRNTFCDFISEIRRNES